MVNYIGDYAGDDIRIGDGELDINESLSPYYEPLLSEKLKIHFIL